MNYIESFNISLNNLKANIMRSFLTVLGVVIGVMSIVLLVSIIAGTKSQMETELKSIGSNVFMVMPGNSQATHGMYVVNKLNMRIAYALQAKSSYGVVSAPSFLVMRLPVKYKNDVRTVTMVAGVTETFTDVRNWKVVEGSNFRPQDIDAARKVAIIGQTVVDDLFKGANPIGKDIIISGKRFKVTGVTEKKGRTMGQDNDDLVAMPITTMHELMGVGTVNQIILKVPDAANLDAAVSETKRFLGREMEKTDFTVTTMGEILTTFNSIMGVLSVVMGAVASIALFVGGIGIMNIMLVTVKERTREIGIRKAVGATFSNIFLQFVIEATAIAIMGGFMGILISVALIAAASPFIPFPLKASMPAVLIAFIFSSATGIFFGTYPAAKAARIDPIVALRYE